MVQMFGVNIGDNSNRGVQFREGPVAFIRLNHHPLSLAKARIAAPAGDDAAIDHSRVDAG